MPNVYVKAICMGMIAGMRSMSAPALVSHYLSHEQSPAIADSSFGLLGSPKSANALKVLAAGEIVADKLPFIPARIAPASLLARALSGAVCGASICVAEGRRADLGGAAGALAAIVSAYGFYHLRRGLGEATGAPDALLGLAEDALAVGVGLSVMDARTSA